MLPLLNAIFTKFSADSALTSAFPGGLHRDRAPEGTAMPYVVSRVVESAVELSYGTRSRTHTRIKFSAFGVGHDATGTLMQTLLDHFDGALLTLAGGAINDSVIRVGNAIPTLHRQDAMGNDVWEWSVVFEYGIVA
jgi:hypothetical protein